MTAHAYQDPQGSDAPPVGACRRRVFALRVCLPPMPRDRMDSHWGVFMLEQVAGARRRWARIRWAVRSARVLYRAGLFRPAHPIATIRLARDVRRWGPLAGAARIAARRWPDSIGLVDDRGALTFGELDRRSNALAWAWRGQGIRQDSAIGLLCRNHRGPVDAMFAAAKLGAQVVPMRTELSPEQLAEVVQREGVTTIVYDQEFAPMLAELPQRVSRYLAWTNGPGQDIGQDMR